MFLKCTLVKEVVGSHVAPIALTRATSMKHRAGEIIDLVWSIALIMLARAESTVVFIACH